MHVFRFKRGVLSGLRRFGTRRPQLEQLLCLFSIWSIYLKQEVIFLDPLALDWLLSILGWIILQKKNRKVTLSSCHFASLFFLPPPPPPPFPSNPAECWDLQPSSPSSKGIFTNLLGHLVLILHSDFPPPMQKWFQHRGLTLHTSSSKNHGSVPGFAYDTTRTLLLLGPQLILDRLKQSSLVWGSDKRFFL